MKLLAEQIANPIELIVEGKGDAKKQYLHGIFLEFDTKNRNGRMYRSDYHDGAVHDWINSKMLEHRGYGECDHPLGASISLQNVSHRIVEMHKDGSLWVGKSIICNTPMGAVVKGLLESGGSLGSSSRGVGSVNENRDGILEVGRDFRLVTPSDLVCDPSASKAILAGIMESVEFYFDETTGAILPEEATKVRTAVRRMSRSQVDMRTVELIANFLRAVRG